MDKQVLKVQKWLNSEYGKVSGFTKINENGRTGWNTIYALREGLQHELGINPVSSGFGPKTRNALAYKVSEFKVGYKGNIAKLIQGAFWCKGYSPYAFNTTFSKDTQAAVDSLRKDAGLSNGNLTVSLMAALFDMSAFKLLDGGTNSVRQMQQYLNRNYLEYFGDDLGLVPTDGIYQRNTNTALIYALQAAEGLTQYQANGVYGPTTVRLTPTVYQGETGPIVKVIQYGLMVNGFYDGKVDGIYSASVASSVLSFRKFMKLEPYNGSADLAVIKGLLTSNGDTNRDSDACDTSFQVSSATAKKLKNFGFNLIGRYLTGTVGVSSNRRRKDLTSSEIENLVNARLSIFPIYQDNDGSEEYFTANQGVYDANVAANAAQRLGFPKGTTIYFAVDTDVQDGDIAGTVIPYMAAVKNHLRNGYKVGIYGTRNVCNRILKQGYAVNAFVSDMSTGYSGNLGYKMTKAWSLDQFTEFSFADIAVDQDASSGRDTGTNKFVPISNLTAKETMKKIFGNFSLDFGKEYQVIPDNGVFAVSLEVDNSYKFDNTNGSISIKNGKLSSADLNDLLKDNGIPLSSNLSDAIVGISNDFTLVNKIDDGNVSISYTVNGDSVKVALSINVFSVDNDITNDEVSFTIELTLHPHEFTGDAEKAYNKLVSYSEKTVAGILITFKYLTTGIIDAIKDAIANDNFKASTTVSSILISVVVVVAFLPVGA